jgi:hypothetical protein
LIERKSFVQDQSSLSDSLHVSPDYKYPFSYPSPLYFPSTIHNFSLVPKIFNNVTQQKKKKIALTSIVFKMPAVTNPNGEAEIRPQTVDASPETHLAEELHSLSLDTEKDVKGPVTSEVADTAGNDASAKNEESAADAREVESEEERGVSLDSPGEVEATHMGGEEASTAGDDTSEGKDSGEKGENVIVAGEEATEDTEDTEEGEAAEIPFVRGREPRPYGGETKINRAS